MKKFLLLLTLTAALFTAQSYSNEAHAQIVKTLSPASADATLTNVDTSYITVPLDNNITAVEGHVTKATGTLGGTIVLQGSIDGTNYDNITSYTLVDQAINYKVFQLHSTGKLIYAKYRLRFVTINGCTANPKGYTLRTSN